MYMYIIKYNYYILYISIYYIGDNPLATWDAHSRILHALETHGNPLTQKHTGDSEQRM
jgi:hypothetical protein